MRAIKLLVLLLVVSGIIFSCGEKPVGNVAKKVLDNGLTVLIKEDHSSPVVSIVTYVSAGYFNEPDSLTGIAHLLEHMYFKGTERRGVGDLARETREAGGYLNAGTSYERTAYYTSLPSYSFEQGLDIQSDALVNSAIDPEELAKESKVVIQEIKRKLDNPDAFSYEKLLDLAFDKHRIRRWRMGYEDQVAGWSRDHLYTFYQDHYRPENIVLSVVGDVNTDEAFELIEKYYGNIERGEIKTEYSPVEPPQTQFKYRRMTGDVNRNLIYVGFHTPGGLHDDAYALMVMDYILSGGRASRFYQEIREKKQLAQSISSYYDIYKDFGYFTASAEQNEQEPLELLKSVFQEIERLKIESVTEAELTRAINQLESTYLHSFEEVNGLAITMAMNEAYGDYAMAFEYIDKLRKVTPADIERVANKYFDITNATILEYLPKTDEHQDYTAKQMQALIYDAVGEFKARFVPGEEQKYTDAEALGVGGSQLPDKESQSATLANGITVVCKENHSVPLVSVAAYFNGGTFVETKEDAGVTFLMAKTAIKGTENMTALEIAEKTEILGSNIGYDIDDDYFGFTFESMSRNFESGFSIFSDVILNPIFPVDEMTKEREYQIAVIKRQKDSMSSYPTELCMQALYENHPYGLPSAGIEEAINELTIEDLKKRHQRGVKTGNLVITFVGDITLDEAKSLTEKYLADMQLGERDMINEPYPQLSSIHTKVENREKAQTAQSFAFITCNYSNPDHQPLKVLQNIVSGMGARLHYQVRESRSLAYTVYGYQSAATLAGSFICYMATSPENALAARNIAVDVLTGLKDDPPTEEEFKRSVNYTAGSFSIYLQTNARQADLYSRWELAGKGYKSVDTYPDDIRKVTQAQVLEVANKYFSTPNYAVGMIEGVGASVKQRE